MPRTLTAFVAAGLFCFSLASAVVAQEKSPWLIRARAIAVVPDEDATISVIGGDVTVDTDYMPELDFTYFFTENIAVELILATTNHNAVAVGTALGDVPLGDVQVLPPTLTLQYHFPLGGRVKPYVGAGINYTMFFDATPAGGAITSISYGNGVGLALQAGIDIAIDDHWLFNIDVKKIFLDTKVSINGGAIIADVDIDPWVVGIGFGYRF